METRVAPAVLEEAATSCAELADRMQAAVSRVQPASTAAVNALGADIYLRKSLAYVLESRTQEFGKFGKYLGELGAALTATAADYRRSDQEAANRFTYLREH